MKHFDNSVLGVKNTRLSIYREDAISHAVFALSLTEHFKVPYSFVKSSRIYNTAENFTPKIIFSPLPVFLQYNL